MPIDVSVVIVNYNTCDLLDACLQSLRPDRLRTEVIVVDNGSSDGSKEMVRSRHKNVRLIENATNRGFAAANNLGISQSSGTYVLLLNSDTTVTQGALEDTVRFMEEKNLKGIVGCRLLNPDGTLQPSLRSFPSILNVASESFFLYKLFPRSRVFGKYYMSYYDYAESSAVDWVMGAFFMIHRDVLNTVGMLDEQFFMFGEELDFCYRARQAGFPTWYFSGATVFHHWGGSSRDGYARVLWTKGSQLLLFQKHFHGLSRKVLHGLLLTGMLLRVPVYVVHGVLSFSRAPLRKAMWYGRAALSLPFRLMGHRIYPSMGAQR